MLYEALVEEIKRKAFIAKSMGQEFTDENYLEEIEKAMGRRAVMGEVRTWRGKEYIKTPQGWKPKPKGYKGGEKKDENGGKDLKTRQKEISSDVKKLNEMSDELEDLEDLMYGDDDDEVGSEENQSEYEDEYNTLDAKFQKLATKLKTSIRKYMKDVNPDWTAPRGADVWDFIKEFNKAKAKKS